jgi:nicotinamide-nucleotide amidase
MSTAPRAAIVVTGDEVLRGRVADRNGSYLAAWCDAHGIAVERLTIVGDDRAPIASTLRNHIAAGVDLLITTGGLGVTHDDLTMSAVSDATGVPLVAHLDALALVRAATAAAPHHAAVPARIRDATERKQSNLPRGALMLAPIGTAPGCIVSIGAQLVVVLPGPPFELERMWTHAVTTPSLLELIARAGGPPRRVLRLHGVVESQLVAALDQIPPNTRDGARLGICAKAGEVELTLADIARGGAERLGDAIEQAFPGATFTRTGQHIEQVIGEMLAGRGQRVAVAESCTGGLLGSRLTSVPGASQWFLGGVIAYDNQVKHNVLGVADEILITDGAVSSPSAAAMACGVRKTTAAHWGVSITGIAGPGGGTPEKPVGTVFVGCAGPNTTDVEEHHFRGDRALIRERACVSALHLLRRALADTAM